MCFVFIHSSAHRNFLSQNVPNTLLDHRPLPDFYPENSACMPIIFTIFNMLCNANSESNAEVICKLGNALLITPTHPTDQGVTFIMGHIGVIVALTLDH